MERIDWSNREEVKKLLKRSGFDIRFAPEEIKSDPEMVLIAATQNETALHYVSEEFSRDPVFMTKLVAENGRALKEFKPKKNMPKEMALIAVKNHRLAMQAIPEQFKNDPLIAFRFLFVFPRNSSGEPSKSFKSKSNAVHPEKACAPRSLSDLLLTD